MQLATLTDTLLHEYIQGEFDRNWIGPSSRGVRGFRPFQFIREASLIRRAMCIFTLTRERYWNQTMTLDGEELAVAEDEV